MTFMYLIFAIAIGGEYSFMYALACSLGMVIFNNMGCMGIYVILGEFLSIGNGSIIFLFVGPFHQEVPK